MPFKDQDQLNYLGVNILIEELVIDVNNVYG